MRFIVLLWLLTSTVLLTAQQKQITSAKITFEFPSKNVKGTISGFESQSKIDWKNPSNSLFKGSVEAATLDTNNGLRNWSLRGSRYFNVKEYPKIEFVSSKIEQQSNRWLVNGLLTIKGITKSVDIVFTKEEGVLVGNATLYSSDYMINIKKTRDDNLVKVNFKFYLTD